MKTKNDKGFVFKLEIQNQRLGYKVGNVLVMQGNMMGCNMN